MKRKPHDWTRTLAALRPAERTQGRTPCPDTARPDIEAHAGTMSPSCPTLQGATHRNGRHHAGGKLPPPPDVGTL
jgi:hypothetical protein